ncbi:ATP-binding cassette domain-containing protein [bacterium LRH843]|nr:ATP-binding cassette domain-containing protein [bacterium LRH843]
MLEAKGICFRYDKEDWILNGVNLTVQPGEVIGLFGPSGYGKTTFARILTGYTEPFSGTVKLDGKPIPKKGFNPVQLIWQHPEKVVNPKWRLEKTIRESGEPDKELLAQLGIKDAWLRRFPNELSGGELQRMCLARALGPNTGFLIADEMTTMLDAITQAQIWQVILRLVKERQMGVVAISHDIHLLKRISTRFVDITEINRM